MSFARVKTSGYRIPAATMVTATQNATTSRALPTGVASQRVTTSFVRGGYPATSLPSHVVERISFASVVHDREAASRHLLASLEALEAPAPAFLLSNAANELGTSLARLYNVLKRLDGPVLRAFVHPDVTFAPDFPDRIEAAVASLERRGATWGALGVVGRGWDGAYVWCHELAEPAEVCTVDSCLLVTRTDLGIDFDEGRFDGLHCVVEDYCLQCHDAGLGVWVIPAAAVHHGSTYAAEGSRWGGYHRDRRRLHRKWRKRYPGLTTT